MKTDTYIHTYTAQSKIKLIKVCHGMENVCLFNCFDIILKKFSSQMSYWHECLSTHLLSGNLCRFSIMVFTAAHKTYTIEAYFRTGVLVNGI